MNTTNYPDNPSSPQGEDPQNSKPSAPQPVPANGLDEYLEDFMAEFKANLEEMNRALDQIAAGPSNRPLLDTLYRDAHNLKGGANALGFLRLGDFLRQIEVSFEPARKRGEPFTPDLAIALKHAFSVLENAVKEAERNKSDALLDFSAAAERLKSALAKGSAESGQNPSRLA